MKTTIENRITNTQGNAASHRASARSGRACTSGGSPTTNPMIATIETRIFETQAQCANVAEFLAAELAPEIIYIGRARVLLEVARTTLREMAKVENLGVPSDLDADWHSLRERLTNAQTQLERIILGSDAPHQPCRLA